MNIIFLGAPGSGKGTQAEILESSLGIKKLSTGDILRNEVKNATILGKKIEETIGSGELISDEIMVSIISKALGEKDYQNGFILDGFPRTLSQAKSLSKMFDDKKIKLKAVIELKVDKQLLIDRVAMRFTCANCGTSYNKKFNNTKIENICDRCHSHDFIHRNDDNAKTLMHRLETFYIQMNELIPYYQSQNILFTVDGMKDIEKVTEDINLILKS